MSNDNLSVSESRMKLEVWLACNAACETGTEWALSRCSSLEHLWYALCAQECQPQDSWLVWVWGKVIATKYVEDGIHQGEAPQDSTIYVQSVEFSLHMLEHPTISRILCSFQDYKDTVQYLEHYLEDGVILNEAIDLRDLLSNRESRDNLPELVSRFGASEDWDYIFSMLVEALESLPMDPVFIPDNLVDYIDRVTGAFGFHTELPPYRHAAQFIRQLPNPFLKGDSDG